MATQGSDPPYVSDIDPFSHEAILDAIHHDSLLREVGPVVYLPQYDIWVVERYAGGSALLMEFGDAVFQVFGPRNERWEKGVREAS
jgi:hypothetical protein